MRLKEFQERQRLDEVVIPGFLWLMGLLGLTGMGAMSWQNMSQKQKDQTKQVFNNAVDNAKKNKDKNLEILLNPT